MLEAIGCPATILATSFPRQQQIQCDGDNREHKDCEVVPVFLQFADGVQQIQRGVAVVGAQRFAGADFFDDVGLFDGAFEELVEVVERLELAINGAMPAGQVKARGDFFVAAGGMLIGRMLVKILDFF